MIIKALKVDGFCTFLDVDNKGLVIVKDGVIFIACLAKGLKDTEISYVMDFD